MTCYIKGKYWSLQHPWEERGYFSQNEFGRGGNFKPNLELGNEHIIGKW